MSCVHLGRCRSPSAVCASQPVVCASPLSCVPPNITCLSCAPGSVVGDRASLSCVAGRLCHACCAPIVRAVACAVRQSCALSSVLAFTRHLCRGRQNFLSWPALFKSVMTKFSLPHAHLCREPPRPFVCA